MDFIKNAVLILCTLFLFLFLSQSLFAMQRTQQRSNEELAECIFNYLFNNKSIENQNLSHLDLIKINCLLEKYVDKVSLFLCFLQKFKLIINSSVIKTAAKEDNIDLKELTDRLMPILQPSEQVLKNWLIVSLNKS